MTSITAKNKAVTTTQQALEMGATHWMDEDGKFVTQDFMDSDRATSDYAWVYCRPAKLVGGKLKELAVEDLDDLKQRRYEGEYTSRSH